jgi:hypothetical protein
MVHVRLTCCDDDCTEEFEAFGPLEQIEALACDCGCALEVIRWLADEPGDDPSVSLLPLAA